MTSSAKPKSIFMTGAHGYIGSAITELAIADGYTVVGLSRSEQSDEKLRNLGAVPVRGDLKSFDVLRRESAKADAVITLADPWRDLRGQNYSEVVKAANASTDAIAEGLKGSGKPFVVASGSGVTAADPSGRETNEDSPLWEDPLNDRISCERRATATSSQGVRACAIRLAPWVYGRGGSGVALFMSMFAPSGQITYIDDGAARTSTVHVEDAARLFMLALKDGKAGEAYNATAETDVTFRQLAEAMGQVSGLPARSKSFEEIAAQPGMAFLAKFLSLENRASNAKAVRELGWNPQCKGILEETTSGSYVEVGQRLKKQSA